MLNKEHNTLEGIKKKILNSKASLNKGLSVNLKEAFPNITPEKREEKKLKITD